MDTEHFKQRLLARERELRETMSRLEEEARDSKPAEVGDPIDQVTADEAKAAGFGESTLAAETFRQVQAALDRIKDGTYGTCIDCGRPIEPARLEAVPWTPYCRDDQEKHDKEAQAKGGDLAAIS
jgi:DnaK suppressor protein